MALLASVFFSPARAQVGITAGGTIVKIFSSGKWTVNTTNPAWTFSGTVSGAASGIVARSGSDAAGDFEEIDYTQLTARRTGFIRAYSGVPAVLFSGTLTAPAPNASPVTSIASYPANLLHMSYSGEFALPNFNATASDSPQIYFDASANTFIVSPASNYMVASITAGATGSIDSGINSAIASLPAGFTHNTLLVYGAGIDATIQSWGNLLTKFSGKTRPSNDADVLLKQVSYWTDNTSTYYYNAGPISYTDTLKTIVAEFASKGVLPGVVQLDSWWYPKGPDDIWSDHGGIWTYNADPTNFPDGLGAFQNAVGTPLATHARWIDAASPYRGQYEISGNVAIDPAWWEMVASYLQSSGVTVYEQDWLGDGAQTAVNLTDPFAFMDEMAAAMSRHGLNMQYCMAEPKHFLQSTLYNNATTIRSSQDGFSSARWTEFLYSGRFASAIGIWPFTDVFQSTDRNNMILAVLSGGPVGVGDAIGSLSRANLLKAARADGVIVKPDTFAAPLDSVYIADAQSVDVPMVVSATTDYGGLAAHFIFAYPRQTNNSIVLNPSDFGITGDSYLYDYLNATGTLVPAGTSWSGTLPGGPGYFVLAPVGKTGIAFLGDSGQFVTLGKKRVPAVRDNGRLEVLVNFAPGEKARTLFGYSPQPVAATAISGSISAPAWDASTQLFTIVVHPPSGGTVSSGTAGVRIVQSFLGANNTGSAGGCGTVCIGMPLPGK